VDTDEASRDTDQADIPTVNAGATTAAPG